MNKQRVESLCEGDEQLLWWAGAVLFAEICEGAESLTNMGWTQQETNMEIGKHVSIMVKEFERLVGQRMEELAKEKAEKLPSLEERVRVLEDNVRTLLAWARTDSEEWPK